MASPVRIIDARTGEIRWNFSEMENAHISYLYDEGEIDLRQLSVEKAAEVVEYMAAHESVYKAANACITLTDEEIELLTSYAELNADEASYLRVLIFMLKEGLYDDCVLYLPFTRNLRAGVNDTDTTVYDRSNFGNHGTIHGAVWQTLPSGKSALSFDGVDDYCYDEATEVLTLRGWIPFKELTTNDFVATLNPETNELVYQRPKRLISYYYEGKMVKVHSRHIDLLVTPNHRMFVSVNKGANIWSEYKLLPAEEILDKKVKYKKDCVWKGQRKEFFELPSVIYKINQHKAQEREAIKIPMNDWLEFFGYYISEGYCKYDEKKSEYSVVIAQSPEKKEKIEKCLKRLPFKFSYEDGKFYISNKQLASYLKQFGKAEDKFIPSWVKQLPPDQLEVLLNALMYGDRHRNQYYTKSKRLADDIQEIVFKIGFSADVSYWTNRKSPIYCVGIQKTNVHPTVGEKRTKTNWDLAKHELVDYSGMVYCCEVPKYHIIYVRRNGKAVWSGNCEVPDSASLNPTEEITVMGWFYLKGSTGVVQNGVRKQNQYLIFWIDFPYSQVRVFVKRTDGVWKSLVIANPKDVEGKWVHAAMTYKSNGEFKGYLNGELVASTTLDALPINVTGYPLQIGREPSGYIFNGTIDEVRIYNRALSAEEINRLFELTRVFYGV